MPIPTSAILPSSRPSQLLRLEHELFPLSNIQRRLAGRSALRPVIDLDRYRFRVVIDWIGFRVHFDRRTQAQHVQAVLRKFLARNSHIEAADKEAGGTFSSCEITVQEPASLALIAEVHRSLISAFGEAAGARVTGLEVSLDAYAVQPSEAARRVLLGALQRTIWTDRDIWSDSNSRPRMAWGKEAHQSKKLMPKPDEAGTMQCSSIPDRHIAPYLDATMYLGARGDDTMIRLMDKVLDRQRPDGSFMGLSDGEKRVRIEVTLKEAALARLGITDIESLRRIRFSRFQKQYFKFRLPTFPTETAGIPRTQEEWRAEIYLRTGVIGLIAGDRARKDFRRAMRPAMRDNLHAMNPGRKPTRNEARLAPPLVSWEAMNRRVNVAFQQLDKTEATAWKKLSTQDREGQAREKGKK